MGLQEFGFGEGDEKIGAKSKRYKAKEGNTDRVSLAWWPDKAGAPDLTAATPKFIGCKRLYIEGVGYVMDKGPEYAKLAGQASKTHVGTVMVVWPTDSKGGIDKSRFDANDFDVVTWIMSTDKYRTIESRHMEFHLGSHDLTLKCTDTQFQKIDVGPCKESLLAKILAKSPERAALLLEAIATAIADLPNDLAQDLTIDQIRDKMKGKSGGGGGASPAVFSGSSNSSPDFDNLLDDVLKT